MNLDPKATTIKLAGLRVAFALVVSCVHDAAGSEFTDARAWRAFVSSQRGTAALWNSDDMAPFRRALQKISDVAAARTDDPHDSLCARVVEMLNACLDATAEVTCVRVHLETAHGRKRPRTLPDDDHEAFINMPTKVMMFVFGLACVGAFSVTILEQLTSHVTQITHRVAATVEGFSLTKLVLGGELLRLPEKYLDLVKSTYTGAYESVLSQLQYVYQHGRVQGIRVDTTHIPRHEGASKLMDLLLRAPSCRGMPRQVMDLLAAVKAPPGTVDVLCKYRNHMTVVLLIIAAFGLVYRVGYRAGWHAHERSVQALLVVPKDAGGAKDTLALPEIPAQVLANATHGLEKKSEESTPKTPGPNKKKAQSKTKPPPEPVTGKQTRLRRKRRTS